MENIQRSGDSKYPLGSYWNLDCNNKANKVKKKESFQVKLEAFSDP